MGAFSLAELRILDVVDRTMVRLGFLKRLVKRVSATATTNIENLGKDLLNTVTKKIQVPLSKERYDYISQKINKSILKSSKKEIDRWLNEGGDPPEVLIELQDLYLADPVLPSQMGRLVEDSWHRYPAMGTNLGLIRKGTYSIMTRGISFLKLLMPEELDAFNKYDAEHNPLIIDKYQRLLLLYSLLENDGEVVFPLWSSLDLGNFSDKDAGNLLPNILRKSITRHRKRLQPIEVRERLDVLDGIATNIEQIVRGEKNYSNSPREITVRIRIEPYVDLGLIEKTDPKGFEYKFSSTGVSWKEVMTAIEESDAVIEFLRTQFFHTAANGLKIHFRELTTPDEIVPYLYRAAKSISSSSGYSPIEELALIAGIWALNDDQAVIEPKIAREALIAYQKTNPYKVRFTVDRSGALAHARFMDEAITI